MASKEGQPSKIPERFAGRPGYVAPAYREAMSKPRGVMNLQLMADAFVESLSAIGIDEKSIENNLREFLATPLTLKKVEGVFTLQEYAAQIRAADKARATNNNGHNPLDISSSKE